jgi:hypothetical protein
MRFSLALAALPALAVAQENPFEQYKAQFQNFLGQMGSYIPNPAAHDPVAALESKLGQLKLNILTLENWKDTLYESISPDTTKPEEWWVLTTGRNKTCYGMFVASLLCIVLMDNGICCGCSMGSPSFRFVRLSERIDSMRRTPASQN